MFSLLGQVLPVASRRELQRFRRIGREQHS
jgi:hypothetical protein